MTAVIIMAALAGAFIGALAVALAVAADREVPKDHGPGFVHLYLPDRPGTDVSRHAYRVFTLYPGQVLSVRGGLVGSPPNEAFSGRDH